MKIYRKLSFWEVFTCSSITQFVHIQHSFTENEDIPTFPKIQEGTNNSNIYSKEY